MTATAMMAIETLPGSHLPLGATVSPTGTNFAVASGTADGMMLAGLGHEAAIAHLVDLGVTAVELLPVRESIPEAFLAQRGLTNYWGYNTIGYFAPGQAYSAAVRAGHPGGQVTEFAVLRSPR